MCCWCFAQKVISHANEFKAIPNFSSLRLRISSLMLKSLMRWELSFCRMIYIFLHTATQFDQDHLLKLQSLFQCVFLVYFCVSTWNWKSSFQLLWRIMLEFGWWFHWICSLFFIEWLFLTTLIWLIHNHGRSIIWCLIQFLSSVSLSSSYTSFSLVDESYFKIFWGYCERYCLPDLVCNQIAIVCREAIDFCVLILCPDTCMEVFILYLW